MKQRGSAVDMLLLCSNLFLLNSSYGEKKITTRKNIGSSYIYEIIYIPYSALKSRIVLVQSMINILGICKLCEAIKYSEHVLK